jgi:hypothetical protein
MLKSSLLLKEVAGPPPYDNIDKAEAPNKTGLPDLRYNIIIDPPPKVKPKPKSKIPPNFDNAAHKYKRPLRAETDKEIIRLLRVAPAKNDGNKLICNLLDTSLAENPSYQALSYCWGDEHPTVEIECDGGPFFVTPNLASALRAFRRTDEPITIWADAICINQGDKEEKNHQVPLMRRIYQQCASVLVWLGNDTPKKSCRGAMQILQTLADVARDSGTGDVDIVRLARERKLEEYGLPHISHKDWKTIRDMVERAWFGRTWIIQEVVVSPLAMLYCDDASLSWEDFQTGFLLFATRLLPHRLDAVPNLLAYSQTVQLMATNHLVMTNAKSVDLLTVLSNHIVALATNGIDKVYGLLGLYEMATGHTPNIIFDYNHAIETVFTATAIDIIQTSNHLDILSVPRTAAWDPERGMPSWVPDWADTGLGSSFSFKSQSGEYALGFDAAKAATVKRHAVIDGSILRVSGHKFKKITGVGEVMNPYTEEDSLAASLTASRIRPISLLAQLLTTWFAWEETIDYRSGRTYPTGGTIKEAYARTLVLDHFNSGFTHTDIERLLESRKFLGLDWSWIKIVGPRTIGAIGWAENKLPFFMSVHLKDKKPGQKPQFDSIALDQFTRMLFRRMFLTEGGYIGVAPPQAREGDSIFLVKGSRVPLVMRPHKDDTWELIGDCYVHGVMHGEAFQEDECAEIMII